MSKKRTDGTISSNEAMEILGVSRPTIMRLIRAGELKARRVTTMPNSPYRIYQSSIDDLLKRREVS